jgi:hypothetical protein
MDTPAKIEPSTDLPRSPIERRIIIQHEPAKKAETGTSGEVIGLLKANTSLAVWLVFLAIGGGLLALYYAKIGYLPDIEWSSTLIYLAVASIIGGGVGLLLAMSVFLPGVIWSDFLVFDSNLSNQFCLTHTEKKPCVRTIMKFLGLPFGVVLIISHISLPWGSWCYWIISAVALVVAFLVMHKAFYCVMLGKTEPDQFVDCFLKRRKSETEKDGKPSRESNRYTFMYAFWFALSILLSQISLFLIYLMSGRPKGSDFAILSLTCTLGVLISNHVVALLYRQNPRRAIVAALVAAAVLIFTADRFAPISLSVMKYYGLGGDVTVRAVINEKDVQIVKDLGLTKCADPSGRRLQNIKVLSKLGDEYLMRCDDHTFTLPKSAVISLQSYSSPK